ncbi:MBL fold metallo-hydrolase RNA specificity domain-containing protein [Luteithermobacter gelatinilyticus]|uniref:MBL fold metallo-hydrolase RNA specificity domain-containing protein n=1 Tax=Luteithermobacter gelatinilyticus TaxID=2582913 RepID=UPI001105EC6E|nr:MBL fold metallo-hydrolase [Luteithermobacter gelatinilyticus]
MKLTFLGATGTVTGSKFLLQAEGRKILIDCGLFQGHKQLRLRNWNVLPVNPRDIDALVLTHAHLDHSGYIPKLARAGFKGPIYCSESTFELCKILLPDSGRIQEEDAERANRYGYTRHKPALPLYTAKEARDALQHFRPVDFGQFHALSEELGFTLHRAGHILGASFVRITQENGPSVLFSGDIGRPNDPVMKEPAKIQNADYLIVESTYGDRRHGATDPVDDLEHIIQETIIRGGTVVIPSFAVGRAQMILYYLYELKRQGRIPANLPIFLDSPMAINVSSLLCRHLNDHRLPQKLCMEVCGVADYTRTVEQSKAIYTRTNSMPKVIVSASGMATGGRVLHHLKHYLGDARNTILLAGFQAGGTRGDRLVRGEKEIKIHGEMWPVQAQIVQLDNMSAHADYEEILAWMENFTAPPRKVFVVHGEEGAAQSMKEKIEDRFDWDCAVPEYKQTVEL